MKVIALLIDCPDVEGEARAAYNEWDVNSWSDNCELCGSHGGTTVDVKCECGKTHEIELSSW